MDEQPSTTIDVPHADAWLAFGLAAVALGVWLLKRADPYLLSMWGSGLIIIGVASAVVGAGMLLRVWR
jgi:hypothetical protein